MSPGAKATGHRDDASWHACQLTVSIVILTYNRLHSLTEVLEALETEGVIATVAGQYLAADAPILVSEVLVVDNCSTDGTADYLNRKNADLVHIRMKRNIGVVARNFGLARASSDIVICLDDDVLGLKPGHVAHIVGRFSDEPRLGCLNFHVIDHSTERLTNWVHHRPMADADGRFATYEITEGAVAFRQEAVRRIGYYHDAFFISHEGPDLAFRLMNAGYAVEYDGSVIVRHKHEQTGREKWRFYYYDMRNAFWLAARNMPIPSALRYLSVTFGAMMYYAVRDGYVHWWLKGVWDGCRGLPDAWRTREVWTKGTRALIREIDEHRPPWWRVAWRRVRRPTNRLD